MKKYFLTGLIILLPVAITVAVVAFLINFFTAPFIETVTTFFKEHHIAERGFLFLSPDQVIKYLSQTLILIALYFVVICLGILTRWFVVRAVLNLGDRLLHKIPVINTVYKTTQEITKTLFKTDTTAFKQVVMAPFPHKGMYALGLVSQDAPAICSQATGAPLVTVLIPTTPNPTAGFLLMFESNELVYIDMKPEEAIKYIVSCGVLAPQQRPLK